MADRASTDILINNQLPEFIRENYETFELFLQTYYEFLNLKIGDDNSSTTTATLPGAEEIINSLTAYRDIDETLDLFVDHFRRNVIDVAIRNVDNEDILTKDFERVIIKHIKDLYLAKGSPRSYELLFRMLFEDNISTTFPRDSVVAPSASTYLSTNIIRFDLGNVDNLDLAPLVRTLNFNNAVLTENGTTVACIGFRFRQIEAIGQARTVLELTLNETTPSDFTGGPVSIEVTETPTANITLTPSNLVNGLELIGNDSTITGNDFIYGYRLGDRVNFKGLNQSAVVEVSSVNSGTVTNALIKTVEAGTINYKVGDAFKFISTDGFGTGGFIVVTAVDVDGSITELNGQDITGAGFVENTEVLIRVTEQGSGYKEIPSIREIPFDPDLDRGTSSGDPIGSGLLVALQSDSIGAPTEYVVVDPGLNYGTSGSVEAAEPIVLNLYNLPSNILPGTIVEFQYTTDGINYRSTGIGGQVSSASGSSNQLTLQEIQGIQSNYDLVNTENHNLLFPAADNIAFYLVGANALPNNTFADLEGNTRLVALSRVGGFVLETYDVIVADILSANLRVISGVIHETTKKHANEFGLLNTAASSVIRDGFFYQEHSYVIESETNINRWRDIVKALVHPAGAQLFSKVFVSAVESAEVFVKLSDVFARQEQLLETNENYDYAWPNRLQGAETKFLDEVNIEQNDVLIPNYHRLLVDAQNTDDIGLRRNILRNTTPTAEPHDLPARTETDRTGVNNNYDRSPDVYYWYDGYSNHSEDISERSNFNFFRYGTNGFTPVTEDRINSRFPKGNTPILVEDALGNTVRELFLPTPTATDNLTTRETPTNIALGSNVGLTRGTMSFDQDNTANYNDGDLSASVITNGNSFWDYEPQGYVEANSTQTENTLDDNYTNAETENIILRGQNVNIGTTATPNIVDRRTLFTDYNENDLKVRPRNTEVYPVFNTDNFLRVDDDKKAPFLGIDYDYTKETISRSGDIKIELEKDLVDAIAGTLRYQDDTIKWPDGPLQGQTVIYEGLDAFQAKWG